MKTALASRITPQNAMTVFVDLAHCVEDLFIYARIIA